MLGNVRTFIAAVMLSGALDTHLAEACLPNIPLPAADEPAGQDQDPQSNTEHSNNRFKVKTAEELIARVENLLGDPKNYWSNLYRLCRETDPSQEKFQIILRNLASQRSEHLEAYMAQALLGNSVWLNLIKPDQIDALKKAAAKLAINPILLPSEPLKELIICALAPRGSQDHFKCLTICSLMSRAQKDELDQQIIRLGIESDPEKLNFPEFTEQQIAHLLLLLVHHNVFLPEVKRNLPDGAYPHLDWSYGLRDRNKLPEKLKDFVNELTASFSEPFNRAFFEKTRPKLEKRIPPVDNLEGAQVALDQIIIGSDPKNVGSLTTSIQEIEENHEDLLNKLIDIYKDAPANQRAANALIGYESGEIRETELIIELLVAAELSATESSATKLIELARIYASNLQRKSINWWLEAQNASKNSQPIPLPPIELWMLLREVPFMGSHDEYNPALNFIAFLLSGKFTTPEVSENSEALNTNDLFYIIQDPDLMNLFLKQPGVIDHERISIERIINELSGYDAEEALRILFNSGDAPIERFNNELHAIYFEYPEQPLGKDNERVKLIQLLLYAGIYPDQSFAKDIATTLSNDIRENGGLEPAAIDAVRDIIGAGGAIFLASEIGQVIAAYTNNQKPIEVDLLEALTSPPTSDMVLALLEHLPKQHRLDLFKAVADRPSLDRNIAKLLLIILNDCLTNPELKEQAEKAFGESRLNLGVIQDLLPLTEMTNDPELSADPLKIFRNITPIVVASIKNSIQKHEPISCEHLEELLGCMLTFSEEFFFAEIQNTMWDAAHALTLELNSLEVDREHDQLIDELASIFQLVERQTNDMTALFKQLKPKLQLLLIKRLAISSPPHRAGTLTKLLSQAVEAAQKIEELELKDIAAADAAVAARLIYLAREISEEPNGRALIDTALADWFERCDKLYADNQAALRETWLRIVELLQNEVVFTNGKLAISKEQIGKLLVVLQKIGQVYDTDNEFTGRVIKWLEEQPGITP